MSYSRLYKRTSLYKTKKVDENLELDLLTNVYTGIDFKMESVFTITSNLAGKPSLISNELYGQTSLGWLIMMFNDIMDPYEELYAGRRIKVPKLKDYHDFYKKNKKV